MNPRASPSIPEHPRASLRIPFTIPRNLDAGKNVAKRNKKDPGRGRAGILARLDPWRSWKDRGKRILALKGGGGGKAINRRQKRQIFHAEILQGFLPAVLSRGCSWDSLRRFQGPRILGESWEMEENQRRGEAVEESGIGTPRLK